MKMRSKCRIWWPKQLSSREPSSSTLLFGWFVSSSSASLDIVVAFAFDEVLLSHIQSDLQGIFHHTNGNMPAFLQDKTTFSILGHCAADFSSNGQLRKKEDNQMVSSIYGDLLSQNGQGIFGENYGRCSCGCHEVNGVLEKCREVAIEKDNWVQLIHGSRQDLRKDLRWIPKLHHIHWNGQIVSLCDLHVIVYETPTFGAHHLSLGLRSSELVKTPLKKPKWVNELHQKQPLLDLDTVILAINCGTAAKLFFERHVGPKPSLFRFRIVYMFVAFMWQLLAMFIASFSTLFYIIVQLLHYGSQSWVYVTSAQVLNNTWQNIQIRCCQVLHWPILLQNDGSRSASCVEYAEKAALHKHSVWSSVAVDIFLGNLVGLALLFHAETACIWVLNFGNDVTNNVLRSGCVWLMGVPAGFKLNTELARVLGMISLNAIQIWSTLWFFLGFLFIYFIKVLAVSGILLGATIPAAMMIDMIVLATLHVSTLHWFIALLYSQQIQAIAALWRLFRGKKWNPLRQRLDSYDYTVEQHIVGSLLFTPLLLLLPTTSVFYIFFSLMNTTISVICILIEVTISIIHATPYIKIFLWLVKPRRFPSGIWLEIISCRSNTSAFVHESGSLSEDSQQGNNITGSGSSVLVSFLHSNFLNIGQIVMPHYRHVFSGVSGSFVASSACGVLTGRRFPATLGTGLPSKMPWMFIPYREYWCICRDAVLTCMGSREHC